MENAIGIVYDGQFYQLLLHKSPTVFKENIRPMEARLPLPLIFSDDQNGQIVNVAYVSNKPEVIGNTVALSSEMLEILHGNSTEEPCSFLPGTVGGSTNVRS
ncbi:hypothetical protein FKQ51_14250 [Bacillus toyonensis]|uniref:hypothetical protein n=1 Tax=Bacillus toyonensis TaxID=155322 RepID=UPI00270C4FCB|nr:hypothetical protein [Bacillus toyonensis]MDO8158503.1 hypothetical protein [Bacillus toyonensis]